MIVRYRKSDPRNSQRQVNRVRPPQLRALAPIRTILSGFRCCLDGMLIRAEMVPMNINAGRVSIIRSLLPDRN